MRDLRAVIADDRQRLEQEVRELRAIVADDRQRLMQDIRDLRAIVTDHRQRLMQLQRHSNPFAISEPIEESPAHPSQFVNANYQAYKHLFDACQVALNPTEIREALRKDTSPIPAMINREGYWGNDHLAYWLVGFAEYVRLTTIAASYGVAGGNYFDFGGSTGRVFRHFHFQSADWRVWSSDFKITSVEWNLAHFPSEITVFQGTYFPFVPIDDRTFDLISAMSVFTHIDEIETSWLLELRRIMKPGGIAIVTIHNEDTWLNMPPELRERIEKCSPELAAMPTLPPGRIASNFRDDDPYRCNVFHSNDYIRTQWIRVFDVKDIIPRASGAQSAVILQRRC